jgi:hypothetical protein
MNQLLAAALEVQSFCEDQGWQFCFIGGIAVLRWGAPRLTLDVDRTILAGFGNELPVIRALLNRFKPRIPEAESFALRNRVLLIATEAGIAIDVSLAGLPFEDQLIQHASPSELDWTKIEQELTWLAEVKEEPGILRTFERLQQLSSRGN